MRIWDIAPEHLCRQHLLGEHRELHGLWNILTQGKTGYARHPETQRWRGRLAALYARHEALVAEMERRGYAHRSPLDRALAKGRRIQDRRVDSPAAQRRILRAKGCNCFRPGRDMQAQPGLDMAGARRRISGTTPHRPEERS